MRVHIYDALGEAGLEHNKPKRSWQEKINMIERVTQGESINKVAISNAVEANLLSKRYKIYQKNGLDGLKLDRRGRRPTMLKKPKISNCQTTKKDLEKELEYLRAEKEYLKKLNALVQKRKDQQPKKK